MSHVTISKDVANHALGAVLYILERPELVAWHNSYKKIRDELKNSLKTSEATNVQTK